MVFLQRYERLVTPSREPLPKFYFDGLDSHILFVAGIEDYTYHDNKKGVWVGWAGHYKDNSTKNSVKGKD